ncbi:MAG: hypothetical protein WCH34_07660 [Bacteroidota bacterium]
MKKFKKYLKRLFVTVILFVIFIIVRLILLTYLYGYDDSEVLNKPKTLRPLNDSIFEQLAIKKLFTNSLKDSIFIFTYKSDYLLLLWKIEQYSSIQINKIIENKTIHVKIKDFNDHNYISVSENPILKFEIRIKLPDEDKLFLCFNDDCEIIKSERTNKYLYYYTNCHRIGLSSKQDYCDALISNGNNSESDFMICSSKGNFYLLLLYSIKDKKVDYDMLFNMINLKEL